MADVTGVGDQDGVVTQWMGGEVSESGVDAAWLGRQGVVAGPDAAGAAELEEVRVQDMLQVIAVEPGLRAPQALFQGSELLRIYGVLPVLAENSAALIDSVTGCFAGNSVSQAFSGSLGSGATRAMDCCVASKLAPGTRQMRMGLVTRSDRLTRRSGLTCRFTRGEAGAGCAAG